MNNETSQSTVNTESNCNHGICQNLKSSSLFAAYGKIIAFFDKCAAPLPPLLFRLILAYEFWEAGMMKYSGENWFSHITFPLPFSLLSNDMLWTMGTWIEIIGAIALLLGFATRFFSLSLIILTIVAISTVHWPAEWNTLAELWQGYAISDKGHGNFKLPLLYLIMFIPLLFNGPGKWSLDYVLGTRIK
ncbi:DoxX family protein [methanotrophic bacterial endosymbiont of Bathymodiolus sp.]|nr:DoxX family protein [methanotrophic bacterial endosymbiont of Bathymodiolus sp.]